MKIIPREKIYAIVRDNKLLDAAGATFVVLDQDLKIKYINLTPLDEGVDIGPGDFLKCHNAVEAPDGCGSHEYCQQCTLRNIVRASMQKKERMESDVDFLVCGNQDCSAHCVSTPFEHEGSVYTVVLLVDKTDKHREFMMERIFLHDILNLSGAMSGIFGCMESSADDMVGVARGISDQLMNEIVAQRDFIYARNGVLKPKTALMKASGITDFVVGSLTPLVKDMWGVELRVRSALAGEMLLTDKTLVNRVIYNMVKNACEANRGGVVTVGAVARQGRVVFSVHNDAVMPPEVKSRVFIFGSSTKGVGRGLGTYSMKLIGENYLGGHVTFRSEEGFGTEFQFELPVA